MWGISWKMASWRIVSLMSSMSSKSMGELEQYIDAMRMRSGRVYYSNISFQMMTSKCARRTLKEQIKILFGIDPNQQRGSLFNFATEPLQTDRHLVWKQQVASLSAATATLDLVSILDSWTLGATEHLFGFVEISGISNMLHESTNNDLIFLW